MDKIELLNLPKLNNLEELNHLLLFTNKQLNNFIFRKEEQYVSFRIPKKNSNEKRVINAPKKYLRMAQKIILREILDKIPCSDVAMAFIRGRNGLLENAKMHCEQEFLLKFDFSNFFQCIKYDKVKELFIEIGYTSIVSEYLAELCTYCKELPQGGICSPCLSNLVCIKLDNGLKEYCNQRNIKYTRYADDLFFSSNEKDILLELKNNIEQIIAPYRTPYFDIQINKRKTKFIQEPWYKKITGITINNKGIKVPQKLKREIRKELYYTILKNKTDYSKLIGQISFVISVEQNYGLKVKEYVSYVCEKHQIKNSVIVKTLNKIIK